MRDAVFFQQGDQAGILCVELRALLLFIGKLLSENFQFWINQPFTSNKRSFIFFTAIAVSQACIA